MDDKLVVSVNDAAASGSECYDLKERERSAYVRTYPLSDDLEREAKAEYKNGVLSVRIMKRKVKVTKISID